MEKACKRKKDQQERGPGGEASFFHGGHVAVVEFAHNDFHHSVHMQQQKVQGGQAGEALAIMNDSSLSTSFLADTGASHHICHDSSYFCDLSPPPSPFIVNRVDGSVDVTHVGTVALEVDSEVGKQFLKLENVLLHALQHRLITKVEGSQLHLHMPEII